MEIVKFLNTVLQDLFNCKCRKQDNNGLEDSKTDTHKTGWVIRRSESKIKEKELRIPTS